MNLKNLNSWSDGRLKCQVFERLANGVLPFEQWLPVFANQTFSEWPGLRCKAFTVWFPTMIDYQKGATERQVLCEEVKSRGIDCLKVFDLAEELQKRYSAVLRLYTRDEQLFLRDRRLQNVHGVLHIYTRDKQRVDWFDGVGNSVKKCIITAAEYRRIMAKFYSEMQKSTLVLLDRLLSSSEFSDLLHLYQNKLTFQTSLVPLAQKLGITGGNE